MPQSTSTYLLRGGLNLVSPQVAVQPGQAIAGLNYEPDVSGYRRIVGFERYDGRPSPSNGADPVEVAARRAAIEPAPGNGAVRGVWVYNGAVYSFRDTLSGGGMNKSSAAGWVTQTFGFVIYFNTGTAEFIEGEVLVGGTSSATAKIERAVLQSGAFTNGDAAGYLVVSDVNGAFEAAETGTSDSGSATLSVIEAIALPAGGRYDFVNHNFYGAAKWPRMYFANGAGTAMEWDGSVLAPIRSGNQNGTLDDVIMLLSADGDNILSADGDQIIIDGNVDRPTHIGQFANHLFLGFDSGGIIHSGVGEPLLYTALDGAGELPFGAAVTGFLTAASTSFVIFGLSRVEYLTGTDEDTFVMAPISDKSGAYEWTVQMAGDQPAYLDEGGVRKLGTTAAFGDWRLGTLTQMIEPLFAAKRRAGIKATASLTMRSKDQYYLFFDDGTGVVIYLGRKDPEAMLFKLPVTVTCACAGELDAAEGERYFIGCSDGFVYEMNRGTSFDGASVPAFLRLAFNALGAPAQQKRFHSAELQVDAPDDAQIGVAFDVDYAIAGNPGGSPQVEDVAAGSPSLIPLDENFGGIDWTKPVQGLLRTYLDGIGRNCALSIVTEHTDEAPHVLGAVTLNYSPRRVLT